MSRHIREELFAQRRFRQLLLLLCVLTICLGVAIVPIERGYGYFETTEDGIWWAVTTVSSVGYGDLVPVTTFGRLIGVFLQGCGVVMLGLLIGLMTDVLSRRHEVLFWQREFQRFDELEKQLTSIQKQLQYLVRSHAEADEFSPESLEEEKNQEK